MASIWTGRPTRLASVLGTSLIAGAVSGQVNPEDLAIRRSPSDGRVVAITAKRPGDSIRTLTGVPFRTADAALDALHATFGINDPKSQLVVQKIETDMIGHSRTTFQQRHRAVPVFSGTVKVHRNDIGQVIAMNGDFYDVPADLDVTPKLTVDEAAAVAQERRFFREGVVAKHELVIVDPGWYGDQSLGARLAYYVELADDAKQATRLEGVFIDAHDGGMLDAWSLIHTVREREIYDGLEDTDIPGTPARFEGDAPVGDADIDIAYDYYGDTYDYFFRAHGRDSIDDAGMPMVATVHSTAPGCPNAFWNGSQMVFCTDTVTDDIVGHELTHGVIQFSAGLIYQNQPGQLNESYADIFGELIDLFNGDAAFAGTPGGGVSWPSHASGPGVDAPNTLRTDCSAPSEGYPDGVRWMLGEDAASFGGAIRDMWSPACFGHPDFANSEIMLCQLYDRGGVHIGSGVPNHTFAILTDGKDFNGVTVTGIGPIKSGAVWYRALTVYLTVSSDFFDAAWAFRQSAQDLVGTFPNDPRTGAPSSSMFTSFDAAQVDLALQATELESDGACGDFPDLLDAASPETCGAETTFYLEDFETLPSDALGFVENNAFTPYDWTTINDLPRGRSGGAMYCANEPAFASGDESGTHDTFTSDITVPTGATHPMLSFAHFMDCERHWDGGFVSVSVGGGPWQDVTADRYTHNGPSMFLSAVADGNLNPDAGHDAFTGSGGDWGTSVASLKGLVEAGDAVRVRFRFAKDDTRGNAGWFVDDVRLFDCVLATDCNANALPDELEAVSSTAGVMLSQIPTASTAWYSDLDPRSNGDSSYVAQRVDIVRPTTIEEVRIWGAHYPDDTQPAAALELAILSADPANNNLPDAVIFEEAGIVTAETFTGFPTFGVQSKEYVMRLRRPLQLSAGVYWMQIRDNSTTSTDSFIWLTSWIDSPFPNIASARSSNNFDWVVGSTTFSLSLELIGYENQVICDTDGSLSVEIGDLLGFLSAWFGLEDSADLDASGAVEIGDLLAFLACWFPASEACP